MDAFTIQSSLLLWHICSWLFYVIPILGECLRPHNLRLSGLRFESLPHEWIKALSKQDWAPRHTNDSECGPGEKLSQWKGSQRTDRLVGWLPQERSRGNVYPSYSIVIIGMGQILNKFCNHWGDGHPRHVMAAPYGQTWCLICTIYIHMVLAIWMLLCCRSFPSYLMIDPNFQEFCAQMRDVKKMFYQ